MYCKGGGEGGRGKGEREREREREREEFNCHDKINVIPRKAL